MADEYSIVAWLKNLLQQKFRVSDRTAAGATFRLGDLADGSAIGAMTSDILAVEVRRKLVGLNLESQRSAYRDHLETWKSLETKAQGAVALAGIFLAAVFAFVREFPADAPTHETWLLIAATACLIAGVACALAALRVRKSIGAPHGTGIGSMVETLLQLNDTELLEREGGLVFDELRLWVNANKDAMRHNVAKSRWLLAAQTFLGGAVASVALLVGWRLVG